MLFTRDIQRTSQGEVQLYNTRMTCLFLTTCIYDSVDSSDD